MNLKSGYSHLNRIFDDVKNEDVIRFYEAKRK